MRTLIPGKGSGFGAPTPLESGMLPVFYRRYIREDERNEELLFVCPSVPDEANPYSPQDEAQQHNSGDEANPHGSEDEVNQYDSEEDDDDDDEEMMERRIIFPPSFYENPDTLEELAAKLIELGRSRQELDVGIGKILRAIDDWSLYRILNFSHIVEYGKKRCELPKPVLNGLITLANRFRRHHLVEKAFRKKLISREQALQILRVVTAENEMIWIDYAAHVSVITLKEEVERCARIIEYDGFAFISFKILPGFRYITDDRYHELSEEMKDILRTGSWYQRSSPELSWPIEENSDERLLMEHDPCIDEPWKHFKDIDELEAYKAGIARAAGENPLCAGTGQGGEEVLCAPLEPASPATPAKSGADASPQGITCKDGACSQGTGIGSKSTLHDEETLAKARGICTMPHDADPAETFLMDILRDSGSQLNATYRLKWGQTPFSVREESIFGKKESVPGMTMSIKFFLPEELFDLWNTVFTIWLRRSVAEEMTDETKDCDLVEVGTDTFFKKKKSQSPEGMAESFLVALLQGWLLTEKAHLKVTRDYAILKRDRFRCQVPGCNCRRNLHIHHIIWRSKGGTDDPENLLCLCEKHHLRLLHNLLTLKIEGTAPHNLTFTFGPHSHGDEKPFLKYVRGRKVLTSNIHIHHYHNAAEPVL